MRRGKITTIPLGTYHQQERPLVEIEARDYDVYFGGSLIQKPEQGFSFRRWIKSPKTLARVSMGVELERYAQKHPTRNVATSLTLGFHETSGDDRTRYSDAMMNTKIAVAPRGTSFETFRWFEGLRSGCVVVHEPVPPWPFYEGAPTITLREWSDLDSTLEKLLSDPHTLRRLHLGAIKWWNEYCSPEAVGRESARIARTILSDHPR